MNAAIFSKFIKRAGEDSDFEVAFSSLGHGKLEDEVPGLMQYLVGFQTLDSEEDKARAVGLFGFKVKKNWLYVPSFYLNGQIKGMDMIYSRAANLFVPLKDNWVGYLMSKEPGILGTMETAPESSLHMLAPDFLTAYTGAGIGKVKSAGWDKIAKYAGQPLQSLLNNVTAEHAAKSMLAAKHASMDLRYWANKVPHFATVLAKTASDHPEFKAALSYYYNLDDLFNVAGVKEAADRARQLRKQAAVKKASVPTFSSLVRHYDHNTARKLGGVVKVSSENVHIFGKDLTEHQKARIYAGDTVYLDTRKWANVACQLDKVAKALESTDKPGVRVKTQYPSKLVSPNMAGQYDVLLANGDTKTMFVAPRVKMLTAPRYSSDRKTMTCSLVYDYDSEQGRMVKTDKMICLPPKNGLGDGNDLATKAHALSEMKPGILYVLVFPDGSVSNIFQCGGRKDGEDATTYQVRHSDRLYTPADGGDGDDISSIGSFTYSYLHLRGESPIGAYAPDVKDKSISRNTFTDYEDYYLNYKGNEYQLSGRVAWWSNKDNLCTIVHRTNDSSGLIVRGGMAVVGKDVKAVPVGLDYGYSVEKHDEFPGLGGVAVMWNTAFDMSNASAMSIKTANVGHVIIHDGVRKSASGKQVFDYLIMDAGLREEQARDIMRKVALEGDISFSIVKHAAPGKPNDEIGVPWPTSFPSSFSDFIGRSATEPQELNLKVPGAESQARQDYPYSIFDDAEVKSVTDAAKSGDKDVFDASALKGLVKAVDISSIIDEYLPDLIRAVDRLGRLRFISFWHIDKLEERFGQQELIDLENHLKADFESLGDTVLFLQRKVTDADPARTTMDDGKLDIG